MIVKLIQYRYLVKKAVQKITQQLRDGDRAVVTGAYLRLFSKKVIEALLPNQCVSCHQLTLEGGRICASCWRALEFIEKPLCDRTGIPFAFDPGDGVVSMRALARPPIWHRARAGVVFDDVSRKLIHALKYYDRFEVGDMMAQTMVRAGSQLLNEADFIVPVPLHRVRLWQRRFNQAAHLAKLISEKSGKPTYNNLLLRKRATRQQVGLQSKDRRDNVKGAFMVDETVGITLNGAKVVLIDDVITTGATASACVQALLDAGCAQVDVLAFALVNNPLQQQI